MSERLDELTVMIALLDILTHEVDGNESPTDNNEPQDTNEMELIGKRQCWVCLATEDEDVSATWLTPCRCKGTSQWVHEICLQRWVDEKTNGVWAASVCCPQCGTQYHVLLPSGGIFAQLLDLWDAIMYRFSPLGAGLVILGTVYCAAAVYGATTIMQVMGREQGLKFINFASPSTLLVGIPSIPFVLILGKRVTWEHKAAHLLRKLVAKVPVLGHVLPSFRPCERSITSTHLPLLNTSIHSARQLCGALLLPSMASLCGQLLFAETTSSKLFRTLLGGLVFLTVKGGIRVFHIQKCYVRQCKRRVLNYSENWDERRYD